MWGSDAPLAPGQVLAAPSTARLRHLPPPTQVADAVPLDLDALEEAAQRARQRQTGTPTEVAEPSMDALTAGPTTSRPTAPNPVGAALPAPQRTPIPEPTPDLPAALPGLPAGAPAADARDAAPPAAERPTPMPASAPLIVRAVAPTAPAWLLDTDRDRPSTADLLAPRPAPTAPATPDAAAAPATTAAAGTAPTAAPALGSVPDTGSRSSGTAAEAPRPAAGAAAERGAGSAGRTAPPAPLVTATAGARVEPDAAVIDAALGTPARRRRPGLLVGSVAAFAAVAIGTAALVERGRADTDTVAAAVTVPDTTAAATTADPTTTASPAPATTAPTSAPTAPTTAPPPVPASSAPTAAPTTAAAPTDPTDTTVTDTTAPASVLGTFVLNREVLDSLGRGTLPTGQPWPRVSFVEGKLVVSGTVPTEADADAAMRAAATLAPSADVLVNRLQIDPAVTPVRYLLVQLFDNPIFDRGSTTVRRDSEAVFELWGKRLREEPGRTLVLIAHGDGTGTSLASTRAKNALARLLAAGGVAPEQVEAQWAAGPATGPRLSFAVPID